MHTGRLRVGGGGNLAARGNIAALFRTLFIFHNPRKCMILGNDVPNLWKPLHPDPIFRHWLTAFAALRAAGANAGRVELEQFHAVNITSSSTSWATGITICLVLAVPPSALKNPPPRSRFCSRWSSAAYVSQIVGRACGVRPCLCALQAGTNGTL